MVINQDNLYQDKVRLSVHQNKLEELRYSRPFVDIMMDCNNTSMMINIFNVYKEIEYSVKRKYYDF